MSTDVNVSFEALVADGTSHVAQGSKLGDTMSGFRARHVAQSQGRFAEQTMRGRTFTGHTAVGGVAPGTTISTTAAYSLYNPLGSGVNLVVLRASMGYVSGTLGAGSVIFTANVNPAAAAVTGTAIVMNNCLIGSGTTPLGQALTTATLPTAPKLLRPFCGLCQMVIATTALNTDVIIQDVEGEFIVTPGCTISLMGLTAAGSSPLVVFGMTWEEVPNS